jgi:PKD repeat protein
MAEGNAVATDSDRVYASADNAENDDSVVFALDPATGTEEWIHRLELDSRVYGPVVSDDAVLFSQFRTDYCLEAASGEKRWEYYDGERAGALPVVSGEEVVFATEDDVRAYDVGTGVRRWTAEQETTASPFGVGDALFTPTETGLVRRDSDTGEREAAVGPDAAVEGACAYADGKFVVPTADGVYAVGDFNDPPSAAFSYEPTDPRAGEEVRFDGSDSADPDGEVTAFRWDLDDDGEVEATDRAVTHAFDRPGEYVVVLEVEDDAGEADAVERTIAVRPRPTETPSPTETPEPAATTTEGSESADGERRTAGAGPTGSDAAGGSTAPTAASDRSGGESATAMSSADGPGFGIGAAAAGVLGGALAALGRDRGSGDGNGESQ